MILALLLLAVVPQFPEVSKKAAAAREANQTTEAIRLYREAVKLRPMWAEGWWYLGTLLYEGDQYVAAQEPLGRFVKLDAGNPAGWAILGLCEYQTKAYDKSLEHLQRALKIGLSPNPPMEPV